MGRPLVASNVKDAIQTRNRKESDMVTKRGTKATKRAKKVKDLGVTSAKAGQTKGGSPKTIEIMDYSFGATNPTSIGSATGGAGAGKSPSISEIKIK